MNGPIKLPINSPEPGPGYRLIRTTRRFKYYSDVNNPNPEAEATIINAKEEDLDIRDLLAGFSKFGINGGKRKSRKHFSC